MLKRLFILILCVIELVLFLLFTIFTAAGSFIAIFTLPIMIILWTVIWTNYLFDILWLITLKYRIIKRVKYSLLVLFNNFLLITLYVLIKGIMNANKEVLFIYFIALGFSLLLEFIIIKVVIKDIKRAINYSNK